MAAPRKIKDTNTNSHAQARKEIAAAEAKIGEGVTALYSYGKDRIKEDMYDAQGIATLEITPEVIKENKEFADIQQKFPDALEKGATLYFYKESSAKSSPTAIMIHEKIKSLCKSAEQLGYVDSKAAQEIETKIYQDIDKQAQSALRQVESESVVEHAELKKMGKETPPDEIKANFTEQVSEKFVKQAIEQTIEKLYQQRLNKSPVEPHTFAKELIKKSEDIRSNSTNILTFNLATKMFTYEEAARVTAHDKKRGQSAANLSAAFAGVIEEEKEANRKCAVKSFYLKHASLAPDTISKTDLHQKNVTDLACTYLHAVDIITEHARIRQHGRSPEELDMPMDIHWNYQLLTSNAWNIENQATAYGFAVRAVQLIDQSTLILNLNGREVPVSVQASLMNAGINKLGEQGSMVSGLQVVEKENRRAYLHLSDVLREMQTPGVIPSEIASVIKPLQEQYQSLDEKKLEISAAQQYVQQYAKGLSVIRQSIKKINKRLGELHEKADDDPEKKYLKEQLKVKIASEEKIKAKALSGFHQLVSRYVGNLKHITTLKMLDPNKSEDIRAKKIAIQDLHNEQILLEKEIEKRRDLIEGRYKKINADALSLETDLKEKWNQNKRNIETAINVLRDSKIAEKISKGLDDKNASEEKKQNITEFLTNIAACTLKFYMDELYYSGEYRKPEKAAIFHAYEANLQRLLGMMTSVGCKSGNDRTWVVRLLIDTLATDGNLLPEDYHSKHLKDTTLSQRVNDNAFSHAAMLACIADTGGGDPKCLGKFKFLSIPGAPFVGQIGEKYAPHKLKHKVSSLELPAKQKPTVVTQKMFHHATKVTMIRSSPSEDNKKHRKV
ncbi:MAG: hypothetical protein ACD_60C00078G0007 [uncultured bacterium]|nr:MAG: hypothetical protein ACD_60C00078G0007 [uncultured bacterium]